MRSHLLRASLVLSLAATGSAQSLPWTITTESTRVTTGPLWTSLPYHEHARPDLLQPFVQVGPIPNVFGEATLFIEMDWAIDVTHTGATPVSIDPEVIRVEPYLNDADCWGGDPGFHYPFRVGTVIQCPPMSVTSHSGRQTFSRVASIQTCQPPNLDDLHVPIGQAAGVYHGPSRHWGWSPAYYNGAGGFAVGIVDRGTRFTSTLEIETRYDLPLVAGTSGCNPLVPNGSGAFGTLAAYGVADTTDGYVVLSAGGLPGSQAAFVALAATTQPATSIGNGPATLCLGAPLYRWYGSLAVTSSTGGYTTVVTTEQMPVPGGVLLPGSTWAFQLFHRDPVGGFNSTNAVVVTFS